MCDHSPIVVEPEVTGSFFVLVIKLKRVAIEINLLHYTTVKLLKTRYHHCYAKAVLSVGNYFFILRILLKEEAFFTDLVFLQKFILKRVPTLSSFLNTLFLSVSLIFKKLLSHFFLALICLVSVVPHNIFFLQCYPRNFLMQYWYCKT